MTPAHDKQLQRTVIRRHMRAASASFHYAHAARWLGQRTAAELRRYAPMARYAIKKIRHQNFGGSSENQYKRRTCGLSNVAKRDIRIRCDLAS